MSKTTGIKWTESTWNPVTGCSKVSAGCKNCYALRDWEKLSSKPGSVYFGRDFTDVAFHQERLDQVVRWSNPRKIFVNSMSDLFHENLSFEQIDAIFAAMQIANWHTYQVLTKRPERMIEYLTSRFEQLQSKPDFKEYFTPEQIKLNAKAYQFKPKIEKFNHIWLGVSIENERSAKERLPLMQTLKNFCTVAWVSAEPLLEPYDITAYASDIDWFVLGGESGPNARIMQHQWVDYFIEQCKTHNIPFLFKQWGEWAPVNGIMTLIGTEQAGDLHKGQKYEEYPNGQG